MEILLKKLREVFNSHDLLRVHHPGQNDDEYDVEIEKFLWLLLNNLDSYTLANTLKSVFGGFDEGKLRELAEDLKKAFPHDSNSLQSLLKRDSSSS